MPQTIIVESPFNVTETIHRLKRTLEDKKITLFALIDHSLGAQKSGLSLNEEVLLIFGDPKVGTNLMLENPAIGLELPLRLLVWKDLSGKTKLAYNDLLALGKSYGIEKNKDILEKLELGISKLISEAFK